ncbi:AI-2E family transporter [Thalassospira lucentensis]|uniref:AI-2E family transporter n=1 Tax=Thalassospira lucentensis TaxID=168935 RepID=UPI003AA8EBB8
MSDPIAATNDTAEKSSSDDAKERVAMTRALLYRRARTISVIGTFAVVVIGCLHIAKAIVLPIILAFLVSLVFSPVVRTGARFRIPRVLTAFTIVLGLTASAFAAVYGLSGPVSGWIDEAPQIERQLRLRFADLSEPLDKLRDAQKQVADATDQSSTDEDVQKVIVTEPSMISQAAQGAPGIMTGIGLMLVLVLFLLTSGDLIYQKFVRALPTFGDRRKGLHIAHDVEREVSHYLATITAINIILGIVIGFFMAILDMPNPFLWGIAAMVLNFVPILGALCGVIIVGVVALVSVQTTGEALIPPAVYLACTVIEGQLITPALVGNRLRINSIAIILAIAFWGWLWGVVGVLVAVPLLIVTSVIANHVEGLGALRELLGPHHPQDSNLAQTVAEAPPAAESQ